MAKGDPIAVNFNVSNPLLIAGVEYACDLFNSHMPPVQATTEEGEPEVDLDGKPVYVTPHPNALEPAAYVRFVGLDAMKSYARQQARAAFDAGDIPKSQLDQTLAAIDAIG